MAKNEIVNVLTIKTEQSQQTIKGLKKEISDLKKTLDNATIGSEQFEQASKELATAQATLKTVLADGNKTTEAVDGSYNHLAATMAELKKQWKATADEAKRNELGKQIDKINSQLKDFDKSIGNNQRLVGSYAEEFKKALAEQDDATLQTRTKLESLQKVASGLASGYAAVQGAMTLLNIENENLQQAMVKVQSAMAIAQGVGGMKDLVEGLSRAKVAFSGAVSGCKMFIGSLSGVQKAIIATGIGALVVAVGLLIANWKTIKNLFNNTSEIEKSRKALAEFNLEVSKLTAQGVAKNITSFSRLKDIAVSLGDDLGKRAKFIKEYSSELEQMGIQVKNNNDFEEVFIKNTNKYITALTQRAKADALKSYSGKIYEEYLTKVAEIDAKIADAEATYKNGWYLTSIAEKNAEAKYLKKKAQLEAERKELETSTNTIMKNASTEITKLEGEYKKVLKITTTTKKPTDNTKDKQKEVDEALRVAKLEDEQKLYDELEQKYKEYLKVYKGNKEKELEIFNWYTDQYTELVMGKLDAEIKANEGIVKSAEETRKKLAEEDKKRYEEAVAASEKRLGAKLGGYDKAEEKQLYTNERRKPEGNGEINAIDNELQKLETLKSITQEMTNLRDAAIVEEQNLFDESSARWIELEQQKVAIREQTERTLAEISRQYAEQEKNRQRTLAKSITSTFTSALSSASQIISSIQEGIDTTNKEGFEKNKKMQIANATIQMLVGITTAMAGAFTTKSGPWDIALAAIQAATIATTGGIQIANIKKQTFDGGGGDVSAGATPTALMSATDIPVSYTRNLMGDAETEEMNKAQQVYILESEIQDSSRKVEVREQNTNF